MIPVYEKGNRSGVKAYHVAIVEVLNVARVQRQRRSLPYIMIAVEGGVGARLVAHRLQSLDTRLL